MLLLYSATVTATHSLLLWTDIVIAVVVSCITSENTNTWMNNKVKQKKIINDDLFTLYCFLLYYSVNWTVTYCNNNSNNILYLPQIKRKQQVGNKDTTVVKANLLRNDVQCIQTTYFNIYGYDSKKNLNSYLKIFFISQRKFKQKNQLWRSGGCEKAPFL